MSNELYDHIRTGMNVVIRFGGMGERLAIVINPGFGNRMDRHVRVWNVKGQIWHSRRKLYRSELLRVATLDDTKKFNPDWSKLK